MIEILALQDGELIGFWHDCSWSRNGGITQVLWSQPVSLDISLKIKIETVDEIRQEETTVEETTTAAEKIILYHRHKIQVLYQKQERCSRPKANKEAVTGTGMTHGNQGGKKLR